MPSELSLTAVIYYLPVDFDLRCGMWKHLYKMFYGIMWNVHIYIHIYIYKYIYIAIVFIFNLH